MNYSQEIRQALNNIEKIYDKDTYSQISLNLSFVNSVHRTILETHTKETNRTASTKSFMDPNCLQKRPFSLSEVMDETYSTQYEPEKRLKTIKKSNSCTDEDSRKCITNKIQDESMSLRSVKTNTKKQKLNKSKMLSDTEVFLFFRGIRTFGIDFESISTNLLPHRSTKELKRFFKEQDNVNRYRIDQDLQLYRNKTHTLNCKQF